MLTIDDIISSLHSQSIFAQADFKLQGLGFKRCHALFMYLVPYFYLMDFKFPKAKADVGNGLFRSSACPSEAAPSTRTLCLAEPGSRLNK